MNILQNAVCVTATGTIYNSTHVHEYVEFACNGTQHFIDGGRMYLRRSFDKIDGLEDLALTHESQLGEVLDKLVWGTYGKDGKQPLTWKKIKDCDLDHLEAIEDLPTWKNISSLHRFVITYWSGQKRLELKT